MDPVTNFLIAPIAKKVTDRLLNAAGLRLQRLFADPERVAALERCSEAGILAMVRTAPGVEEAERAHLNDVLRHFFTCEEIADHLGRALTPLLQGHPLDLAEMEALLVEAGFDPETLPGFNCESSFTAFAGGFAAAVLEQPSLREELKTHLLFTQLELQREIRDFLQQLVRFLTGTRPGSAAVAAGEITAEDVAGNRIFFPAPVLRLAPARSGDWEAHYLRTLIQHCDALDLSPIDETHPRGLRDGEAGIRLSDVFTTLHLEGIRRRASESAAEAIARRGPDPSRQGRGEEELRPVAAVEAAGSVPRLVVLGRPGGGKSTLVNHLVVQLAKRRHGMTVDSETLPGWPADESPLPVRILLRRFASWLPEDAKPDPGLVWDYLEYQLERDGCRDDSFDGLYRVLTREGGVIFFDGLDEVHEDDARRKRSLLCAAIERFAEPLPDSRVIVTCREYAYRRDDAWRLPDAVFPEVALAPFDLDQVRAFTRTWYRVVGPSKGWDAERCESEAAQLARAVADWEHLRALAESPLLLTLMTQIHGCDGYLPHDRADLYQRTVNLLLAHWENRIVRDLWGGSTVDCERVQQLNLNIKVLRSALEKVAFVAHERQERESSRSETAADIPGDELLHALEEHLGSLDRAREVIVYIEQRAGLLHAVGQRTYRFPHRTFQEYLAARHLLKQAEYPIMLRERVHRDLPWWWEVFLLAAGSARETPRVIADLVDELVPRPPGDGPVTPDSAEEARLAAQALDKTRFREGVGKDGAPGGGRFGATLERIQDWLLAAIAATESLDAAARARCGRSLAALGDPRQGVTTVEGMELCLVPAGPFHMGSAEDEDEGPPHLNEHLDYDFWIARYPVTVAQFRQYVAASGEEPGDDYALWGDTAPVVQVSWHEARGFCRWLTAWLTSNGSLPAGWEARLPLEAEWEKASRGGLQIPKAPVIRPVVNAFGVAVPRPVPLIPNPDPVRAYPWEGSLDGNLCNLWPSDVRSVSVVGCFPNGRSVYGCEEMSGNVVEWTGNQYHNASGQFTYPYMPTDGRENPDSHAAEWILRGGSFINEGRSARCSARSRYQPPQPRSADIGFRLVFSPSAL